MFYEQLYIFNCDHNMYIIMLYIFSEFNNNYTTIKKTYKINFLSKNKNITDHNLHKQLS